MTRTWKALAALAALTVSLATQAAGFLLTNDKPGDPRPLRWNTSAPIPVYTDLGVFSYAADGVTPFITNQRAREMVAFALKQWSDVPTSTLKAYVAGDFTKVPSIGVDVTADNVGLVYGRYNGGGMHVVFDTDGRILEEYFGVPRDAVLGIAFPEFAIDTDGDGYEDTIIEATALMNGYAVDVNDTDGSRFNGVMTHEFGHAFNLSHSQVNGQMAFFSIPGFYDLYPGVPSCVAPMSGMAYGPEWGGNPIAARYVETMFPFIDPRADVGREMSTVDRPDDVAAISSLYPTPAFLAGTGSITGVLRLKDGRTPYNGINVIARNVSDPLGDAVSAMTGDKTQGKIGPDGRFTITNLRPGQQYVVYIEEIVAGGYPTTPRPLVSQAEYWNVAESSNPATDQPCDATPITATAGATARADITFNGYAQGVQYYPVVDGNLVRLSKNGGRASGVLWATAFIWDAARGIQVLPPEMLATNGGMTRNGQKMLVNADLNRNGISSAVLWNTNGSVTDLGSLNGDTCGGDGFIGKSSSYGMAVDDEGRTAVGVAYVDSDGDGNCQSGFKPEILPFIWTDKGGMRSLDTVGHDFANEGWLRAQAVSGDGTVVLGETNYAKSMAWVNGGKRIDLYKLHGAINAYAINRDGTRAAMDSVTSVTRVVDGYSYQIDLSNGPLFWNARQGPTAVTRPTPLSWCTDIAMPPYYDWFTGDLVDPCALGASYVLGEFGRVPMQLNDVSDDGRVVIGRAGSDWYGGFTGVMWVEGVGWIKLSDFFRKQGVAEAYRYGLENPVSLSGAGNEMVGGLMGVQQTWYVDMKQVFVCQNGVSVQTGFPGGFIDKMKAGARMGRCEHQS
jgi:hypothetical protein